MAILKNPPTNPKKGPGKGTVKEKIKKDPKTGREFSVADKGMSMKKTLVKNAKPAKTKAVKKMTMKKESKPMEKAMPKSKTIKADSMTEKEIMEKKKSFESKTGKTYMSKDETYNKLERKLGRKPTVAEYNKSLK